MTSRNTGKYLRDLGYEVKRYRAQGEKRRAQREAVWGNRGYSAHLCVLRWRHRNQKTPPTTIAIPAYPRGCAYCTTIRHQVPSAHPRLMNMVFHRPVPNVV